MPELPEVEVVRAGLQRTITGRTITAVEVFGRLGERILRRFPAGPDAFRTVLTGARVDGVRRRGKYLWWVLGEDALLAHLGMSGQFRIAAIDDASAGGTAHPHVRVRLHLDAEPALIDFVDQRTFGSLTFIPGGADLPAPIAHIARDLLDPGFDAAAAVRRLRSSRLTVKRVLLDQTVVSGIGKIHRSKQTPLCGAVSTDRACA